MARFNSSVMSHSHTLGHMATFTESQAENSHEFASRRDRLLLFVLLAATLLAAYLVYRLLEPFLPALAPGLGVGDHRGSPRSSPCESMD